MYLVITFISLYRNSFEKFIYLFLEDFFNNLFTFVHSSEDSNQIDIKTNQNI